MSKKKIEFALGVVQKSEDANNNTKPTKDRPPSAVKPSPAVSKLGKQMDQVLARMMKTSENIDKAKQALNVDLFLQEQKEKRMKYAKELQENFQKQKQMREEKLYKKKQPTSPKAQLKPNTKQNNQAASTLKGPMSKYLKQLPRISRKPVELRESPYQIESHTLPSIREYLEAFNCDNHKQWEEEQGLRQLKDDQPQTQKEYVAQKMEKVAEDATKAVFADIDKQTGDIVIRNDLVIQEQNSENLVNALVLILSNKDVFSRVVVNNKEISGVEGIDDILNKKKGSGLYLIRMFRQKSRVTCVTSGLIPVTKLEFNLIPKYSYCHSGNRFWLPIMEKAYKNFRDIGQKRLGLLSLNEIVNDYLDLDPEVIRFNEAALIAQNLFKILEFLISNKSLIAFMRKGEISGKASNAPSSYENRIYPIKSVRLSNQILQCVVEVVNPWKTKLLKSDGSSFLNLKDLLLLFNRLVVVKDYPKEWSGVSFNSQFFMFGPPTAGSTQWTKNNQHIITVSKTCDCRILLKRELSQISLQNSDPGKQLYGFLLFKVEPDEIKVSSMNLQRLVMHEKSTEPNQASGAKRLEKGTYMLIPYSGSRSDSKYCFLRFQIFFSKEQAITLGNTRTTDVRYNNVSNQPGKVMAELEETVSTHKVKTNKILEPKQKRLLVPDCDSGKQLMLAELVLQNQALRLQQIFYPGFLKPFLVKNSVAIVQVPPKESKSKSTVDSAESKNDEVIFAQQNQIFKTIIGTDAFTEEVDRTAMEEAMVQLEDKIDLAHYGLNDQAFQTIAQVMTEQPRIVSIDLSDNELTDKSIVQLCYFLEKSNHSELRQIRLDDNLIGDMGAKALKGLMSRFRSLERVWVKNNKDISSKLIITQPDKSVFIKP